MFLGTVMLRYVTLHPSTDMQRYVICSISRTVFSTSLLVSAWSNIANYLVSSKTTSLFKTSFGLFMVCNWSIFWRHKDHYTANGLFVVWFWLYGDKWKDHSKAKIASNAIFLVFWLSFRGLFVVSPKSTLQYEWLFINIFWGFIAAILRSLPRPPHFVLNVISNGITCVSDRWTQWYGFIWLWEIKKKNKAPGFVHKSRGFQSVY